MFDKFVLIRAYFLCRYHVYYYLRRVDFLVLTLRSTKAHQIFFIMRRVDKPKMTTEKNNSY